MSERADESGAIPPPQDPAKPEPSAQFGSPEFPRRRREDRVRRWPTVVAAGLLCGTMLFEMAVPNLGGGLIGGCRLNANESAAIATLKNVGSAQRQLQERCAVDVDGDGVGEFGTFAELAASVRLRSREGDAAHFLEPPLLSSAFGAVRDGRVRRSGYVFQAFLPGVDGWLPEAVGGGATRGIDTDRAEREWLCYAWPIEHGRTSRRAFATSACGDVLASEMRRELYSGDRGPIGGVAAFSNSTDGAWQMAANTTDVRGNVWVVVQ